MKSVEFTRDMRPWRAGDRVPLPDTVADDVLASGEAINPRTFPGDEPIEAAKADADLRKYKTKSAK